MLENAKKVTKKGSEWVFECPQDDENYLYLDETWSCIEPCSASLGNYKLVYKTNRKCVKKYDQRFYR